MSQSLPEDKIRENAQKYKLIAEAKKKHKGTLCLGCPEQSWDFFPNPCKDRKRWQGHGGRGFCTKKQLVETKAKTQSKSQERMDKI